MVLELLGQVGYLGVAFFALVYRYSGLPKLDWGHITSGAMLMFSAAALTGFTGALSTWWGGAGVLDQINTLLVLVGALLVLVGGVKNAVNYLKA